METNRMLKYIEQLPPHPIQSTVNLNHSRELILKLTEPLAQITRLIEKTKEVIEDEIEELEQAKLKREDLCRRRIVSRPYLELVELDHPKTVCGHMECKEFYNASGEQRYKYLNVCHDRCRLKGVARNTIGDDGLLKCWAMNGGMDCQNCGHSYKQHLHIYYDTQETFKDFLDEGVIKALEENKNLHDAKREIIESKKAEMREYEEESQEINKASAKFARFLKTNAITPYNDALLEYLEYNLLEAKEKIARGGGTKEFENLCKVKANYQEEINLLENQLSTSSCGAIGSHEIDDLVCALYKQKHTGAKIHEAMTLLSRASNSMAHYEEGVTTVLASRKKQRAARQNFFYRAKNYLWGNQW